MYLNFITPDTTLTAFSSTRFMYRTYFVKFEFRRYWELKTSDYIHGHFYSLGTKKVYFLFFIFSVSPGLIIVSPESCSNVSTATMIFDWHQIVWTCCYWLKILSIKASYMQNVSHVKYSLFERAVFCLSKKHWLIHSLSSFSYTKSVTWWYRFKKCL